jgi:Co/Zn/Cd efflux system component
MTDALTSVAAILALLGGKLFGWDWLDPLMGVVGSVVIGLWAKGLLMETGKALLDREMDTPLVKRVQSSLSEIPDTEVVDLHLWRVGRAQYCCLASVVTHGSQTPDQYKNALQTLPELVHTTVEVNRCCREQGYA